MRPLLALVLVSVAMSGCTPYLAVKDDFGTSALLPAADTPRAYTAFNAYDPVMAWVVADQICATPYEPLEQKGVGAVPGSMIETTGRCETHKPIVGNDPW
jgi:hypothetical protein